LIARGETELVLERWLRELELFLEASSPDALELLAFLSCALLDLLFVRLLRPRDARLTDLLTAFAVHRMRTTVKAMLQTTLPTASPAMIPASPKMFDALPAGSTAGLGDGLGVGNG
jgi:hypothetical protein